MKRLTSIVSLGLAGALFAGCAATQPTPQLVDARQAYHDAANSPAASEVPDHLLEAKQALEKAEMKHQDEPGSQEEAHLAYLALREAQLAKAQGDIASARKEKARAEQNYGETQDQLRQQAQQNLSQTRDSLQNTEAQLQDQRHQNYKTTKELEAERRARLAAEQEAAAALASLKEVASVKEEANRTVITLSGSVLFKTADASLLSTAESRLDMVAKALKDQQEEKEIVVEGYTDSRGTDEYNQKLSQNRAESVRNYLIQQGVDSSRITAVGKGETNPIATNDTPEGRANNRRVEIVISENSQSQGQSPSSQGQSRQSPSSQGQSQSQ